MMRARPPPQIFFLEPPLQQGALYAQTAMNILGLVYRYGKPAKIQAFYQKWPVIILTLGTIQEFGERTSSVSWNMHL